MHALFEAGHEARGRQPFGPVTPGQQASKAGHQLGLDAVKGFEHAAQQTRGLGMRRQAQPAPTQVRTIVRVQDLAQIEQQTSQGRQVTLARTEIALLVGQLGGPDAAIEQSAGIAVMVTGGQAREEAFLYLGLPHDGHEDGLQGGLHVGEQQAKAAHVGLAVIGLGGQPGRARFPLNEFAVRGTEQTRRGTR